MFNIVASINHDLVTVNSTYIRKIEVRMYSITQTLKPILKRIIFSIGGLMSIEIEILSVHESY